MAHLFTPSSTVALSMNLDDGATDLFPRAFIFSNGSLITSVDLGHVGLGRYSGTWITGSLVTYDALFVVYDDAGHGVESTTYTREMEKWQNDTIFPLAIDRSTLPQDTAEKVWDELLSLHTGAESAGEFLARLTQTKVDEISDTNARIMLVEKILRNRLELMDGASGNWVLYDDDGSTPLLTWSVTDKDGVGIAQQKFVPSRRTRGV